MSRRNKIFGAGLLLAAMSAPTTARAQQPASPPPADYPACTKTVENSEDAKNKFIAARQDYAEGNFDSALKRFRDAYALDCKPELLLLISATWVSKGDKQQALYALELYIQRAPKDAPDIVTTQQKIESLKKQIAAQAPAPGTTPPARPPSQTDKREHTVYPWLVVGGGVVAVAVGVVLLATSPDLPANCQTDDNTCKRVPDNQLEADFKDDQARAGRHVGQNLGGILTIVGGGALIAGGVVWHFLEPTGPKEKSARVAPAVGPGFAGLSLTGKF